MFESVIEWLGVLVSVVPVYVCECSWASGSVLWIYRVSQSVICVFECLLCDSKCSRETSESGYCISGVTFCRYVTWFHV